jgi:hypothetical protein
VRASVLAIALAVLAVVGAFVYRINEQPPCIPFQDVVLQGETLETIAEEYLIKNGEPYNYPVIRNYVVDIQVASGLNSDQVTTGLHLVIPNLGC